MSHDHHLSNIPPDLAEYLADELPRAESIFYLKESAETMANAKAKYWDFADEVAVVRHPVANGGVLVLTKYRGQWGTCNHSNRQIVGALLGVRENRRRPNPSPNHLSLKSSPK
jgi:hypothetical protein